MSERSLWRRLRRRTRAPRNAVLAAAIAALGRLLGLLPVPVALAVGRGFGLLGHACLVGPRQLALIHLALAFPEADPVELRRLARATFRHAGESFAELALFPKLLLRPDYVRAEGLAALDDALAEGRGAIAVTGHVGNWELLAAWAITLGYPLTVVVRRVYDLRLHALVARFRRAAGVEIVVRDNPAVLAAVRAALRRNRVVALLIDQDTRGAGVFVPFFGRLARTPPGAALIALRGRVPVVTAFLERRAGGGHTLRVERVPLGPRRERGGAAELTARLTAAIEAQIRRAPAEWVWWHRRWRRRPARPAPPVRVPTVIGRRDAHA